MLSIRLALSALMGLFVFVCFAQPAAPQVSIEITDVDGVEHVKISWEEVEGAESYTVYVSNNPYTEDWGEPLTTVGEGVTEYITDSVADLGRDNYFHVTSFGESEIPDWLVLVAGDLFNGNVAIDPFYISKYQVTQADFVDIMGEWDFAFGGNPTHPVEQVGWFDAVEYCNRLSIQEELQPVYMYNGRPNPDDWYDQWPGWNENGDNHINVSCNWEADGYRLPTEAEWQYAANGAVHDPESQWPFGSPYKYAGSDDLDEVAWYSGNGDNQTHPVGTKAPNGLNIYDMSGNVFEWCWDIYGADFPSGGDNPRGADGGDPSRVLRGGSWLDSANDCTVSRRIQSNVTDRFNFGFRICKVNP